MLGVRVQQHRQSDMFTHGVSYKSTQILLGEPSRSSWGIVLTGVEQVELRSPQTPAESSGALDGPDPGFRLRLQDADTHTLRAFCLQTSRAVTPTITTMRNMPALMPSMTPLRGSAGGKTSVTHFQSSEGFNFSSNVNPHCLCCCFFIVEFCVF